MSTDLNMDDINESHCQGANHNLFELHNIPYLVNTTLGVVVWVSAVEMAISNTHHQLNQLKSSAALIGPLW